MEILTVTISGQYASSNSTFSGSKKQVLNFLRESACGMRRDSRVSRHLPDNVHSIPEDLHTSKLVTMSFFSLNKKGIVDILKLINLHGVLKYNIN